MKFTIEGQKEEQELVFGTRIDDDGDFCVDVNGVMLFFIDKTYGKLNLCYVDSIPYLFVKDGKIVVE